MFTLSAIVSYVHLAIFQVSSTEFKPMTFAMPVQRNEEVMGSNPIKDTWKIFQVHMRQSLRSSSKCQDHFLQFISQRHFTKHFFHCTITSIIWCCSSFSCFQVLASLFLSLLYWVWVSSQSHNILQQLLSNSKTGVPL